jgi:hypothetical protein
MKKKGNINNMIEWMLSATIMLIIGDINHLTAYQVILNINLFAIVLTLDSIKRRLKP